MKIEPLYVTFEQAKLLKEKGFDIVCRSYYRYDGVVSFWEFTHNANNINLQKTLYSRPEQYQLIEWLRVVHGIWISSDYSEVDESFTYKIHNINTKELPRIFTDCGYKTPQEAYSAAFDYTLKELI